MLCLVRMPVKGLVKTHGVYCGYDRRWPRATDGERESGPGSPPSPDSDRTARGSHRRRRHRRHRRRRRHGAAWTGARAAAARRRRRVVRRRRGFGVRDRLPAAGAFRRPKTRFSRPCAARWPVFEYCPATRNPTGYALQVRAYTHNRRRSCTRPKPDRHAPESLWLKCPASIRRTPIDRDRRELTTVNSRFSALEVEYIPPVPGFMATRTAPSNNSPWLLHVSSQYECVLSSHVWTHVRVVSLRWNFLRVIITPSVSDPL